jgi:hypothetical protein
LPGYTCEAPTILLRFLLLQVVVALVAAAAALVSRQQTCASQRLPNASLLLLCTPSSTCLTLYRYQLPAIPSSSCPKWWSSHQGLAVCSHLQVVAAQAALVAVAAAVSIPNRDPDHYLAPSSALKYNLTCLADDIMVGRQHPLFSAFTGYGTDEQALWCMLTSAGGGGSTSGFGGSGGSSGTRLLLA